MQDANVARGGNPDDAQKPSWSKRFGRGFYGLFPLQMYLLDEYTARFHGTARAHWYLSDGGHFAFGSVPQAAVTSFTQADVAGGQIIFVHHGAETAPSYDVAVSEAHPQR